VDVNIEFLLGKKVRDSQGNKVGRIEEFRVTETDKACLLDGYLIGTSALVDRLSAWTLVRPIARLLRNRRLLTVYEVPWQDMDLSDLDHPILRVERKTLRHAK
jgi:sporulation protein YlmC with PRC-barrel domain